MYIVYSIVFPNFIHMYLVTWFLTSSSLAAAECPARLGLTGLITANPFSRNILALPSLTRKLTWNMFSIDLPKQEGSVTNLNSHNIVGQSHNNLIPNSPDHISPSRISLSHISPSHISPSHISPSQISPNHIIPGP